MNQLKQIPLFFTFDRHYVVPAAVAFYSLLRHASALYFYKLYVLHTSISPRQQQKLTRLVERFPNADLTFIDVSRFDTQPDILQGKSHFSKEIYYKLLAADLFPQYDRILCSDVDVVFTGDIAPSYFLFPDDDFYYAGVGQILESGRMQTYEGRFDESEKQVLQQEIMAGYLLFNLKAMRADGMQQRLTDFYRQNYHRLPLPEQDCLILCCWPRVRQLPLEYVVCNNYYRIRPSQLRFYAENASLPADRDACLRLYRQALEHPVQLHYVGPYKPWNSFRVSRQRLWFATLEETGYTIEYVKALPVYVAQRLKRYSLKRFLHKVYHKLIRRTHGK